MLYTKTYYLDIRSWPWELAHILEHVIITESEQFLHQHAQHKDFLGWITGNTFNDYLFIDVGFYNKDALSLFEPFLSSLTQVTQQSLEHALTEIECEYKKQYSTTSSELLGQLNKLLARNQKWNKLYDSDTHIVNDTLATINISDEIKTFTLSVQTTNAFTPKDLKLFTRLRVIIADIILNTLQSLQPTYETSNTPVVDKKEIYSFEMTVSIKQPTHTARSISDYLNRSLHRYPIRNFNKEIAQHFNAFSHSPLWLDFTTETYKNTGLIVSREEIAQLATIKRIEHILENIKVSVHNTSVNSPD